MAFKFRSHSDFILSSRSTEDSVGELLSSNSIVLTSSSSQQQSSSNALSSLLLSSMIITSSVSDVCTRLLDVVVVDSSFIRLATLLMLFAEADINEDIDIEGDEYAVDLMLVLLLLTVS